jgi:dTDP-4-dehydrorhamnose reductase
VSRPLLILGRSGQVARELQRLALEQGRPHLARGRDSLDLLSGFDADRLLDELRPTAVVNAAAYTAVDRAEEEPEAAYRLNRDVPGSLARACAAAGVPFVHFSTDYVFDGTKAAPYVEDDPRNPLNVYGRSKAEGEDAVEAAGGRFVVLRTSWVYSAHGANFVRTMLRLAQARAEVDVVSDQLGTPTWGRDLAEAALQAADALAGDLPAGVLHVAGAGEATWADLAEAIFEDSAARGRSAPEVRRIRSADFPTRARRPLNSRLSTVRLPEALDCRPRPWREALAACLQEIAAGVG